MNLTTVLTHLSMLIIGGLIGYQICNQSPPTETTITPTAKIENPVKKVSETPPTTNPLIQEETTTSTPIASTKVATPTTPITTLPTTPVREIETTTTKVKEVSNPSYKFENATANLIITPSSNVAALCFEPDQLSLQLSLFAEKMEKDSLIYDNKNPSKLQDCSGIFHRVAQHVSTQCDAYDYPIPKSARDSRSLARWYNKKNNLIIVNNPMTQRNLIKPGAVMFFGKSGKKYKELTVKKVTANRPNHIIQHIGVVTEVKKDDDGNVIGYTMLHGRRPGVTAQRSHYHQIKPPRLGFPILGNWNQQWVAMAYIAAPKKV